MESYRFWDWFRPQEKKTRKSRLLLAKCFGYSLEDTTHIIGCIQVLVAIVVANFILVNQTFWKQKNNYELGPGERYIQVTSLGFMLLNGMGIVSMTVLAVVVLLKACRKWRPEINSWILILTTLMIAGTFALHLKLFINMNEQNDQNVHNIENNVKMFASSLRNDPRSACCSCCKTDTTAYIRRWLQVVIGLPTAMYWALNLCLKLKETEQSQLTGTYIVALSLIVSLLGYLLLFAVTRRRAKPLYFWAFITSCWLFVYTLIFAEQLLNTAEPYAILINGTGSGLVLYSISVVLAYARQLEAKKKHIKI